MAVIVSHDRGDHGAAQGAPSLAPVTETGLEGASIALDLEAQVEGLPIEKFRALAEAAKTNCPVSKALSATPMSLTARLA